MKYLGLDYGSKRIGLSVSDDAGAIAFPLEVLANDGRLFPRIMEIIGEKRIGSVVVGDTRSFGGGKNPITPEMEKFVEALAARGVRVERVWEAGSSAEASRYAPEGKGHDDAAAAAIILQRFLDMKKAK